MGQQWADQYSLLHFASGVMAYFLGLTWTQWFVLHGVFELLENTRSGVHMINTYLTFWPGGKPEPDWWINMAGDQLFAMIGWMIAYGLDALGKRRHWYLAGDA